jgi:hypothetical protein
MRPDKSDEAEEARAAEEPQSSEETAAADEVGEDEGAPGDDRMKFRPSFLDENESRQATAANAPAPGGDTFFVTVERDGAGEVHRFSDPAEAQRFVESLLEDGVPEDGVAAFAGHRLTVQVRHRPVVKLSIGSDA